MLLLRPPFYCSPIPAEGLARGKQLRSLLVALRHAGGHGGQHLFDGNWQLILQLPVSGQRPEAILQIVVRQLALPIAPLPPPSESIAIRHLIAQLPERLGTSTHQEGQLTTLTGGSAEDTQQVAHQLSRLTILVNPPMPAPTPRRRDVERPAFPEEGTTLLVFIPLPEGASLVTLRVLTQFCEPSFFQCLRVKQQIGYVMSCRYQRVTDRDGLLMALQSSGRYLGELLRCCKTFLRRLDPMDEMTFGLLQQRLAAQTHSRIPPKVRALNALRQEYNLPGVTPQAADALRIGEVVAL